MRPTDALRRLGPGVTLCAALALAGHLGAQAIKSVAPLDAGLLALLLGLAAGLALRHPGSLEPGSQIALKRALAIGVVLLGFEIDVAFLARAGPKALLLVAALVPLTLTLFLLLARSMKLDGDAGALLGVGTSICGASAVVAAGTTLKSKEEDVAVAVAAVGLLSAIGVFLYPAIGLAAGVPEAAYGAWSGLSLHAVANAVAAGFAYGPEAGRMATLVKMARVALLAPVLLAIALALRRERNAPPATGPLARAWTLLPPMVWGFLAAALLASLTGVPEALKDPLRIALRAAILTGLAALGYTVRPGNFRRAGARALAVAVGGWVVMSAAALGAAWAVF